MIKAIDLTGVVFGDYTVLERDLNTTTKSPMWLCKCACGKINSVNGASLRYGDSHGCHECNGKKQYKNVAGEIPTTFWCSIKNNAKSRGRVMSITPEEAWQKYLDQKGKCAITGLSIGFRDGNSKGNCSSHTASLDRIDSSKGYETNNIQWVYKLINIMKSNIDEMEFIALCVIVAENLNN